MSLYFQLRVWRTETFPCMCAETYATPKDNCTECNGNGEVHFNNEIAKFRLGNSSKLSRLMGTVTGDNWQFGTRETDLQEVTSVFQAMSPLTPQLIAILSFITTVCVTMPDISLSVRWS